MAGFKKKVAVTHRTKVLLRVTSGGQSPRNHTAATNGGWRHQKLTADSIDRFFFHAGCSDASMQVKVKLIYGSFGSFFFCYCRAMP